MIQEKISREEIASWALTIQQAEDVDELEYDPSYNKELIDLLIRERESMINNTTASSSSQQSNENE